jgi:peptide/nickel transport system permease protein
MSDEAAVIERPATAPAFWQRHRFAAYVCRRIAAGVATVLAASVVIFVALLILPGDVVDAVLGRSASPQAVKLLEQQLNGGLPAWQRYFRFLGDFFRGDFGYTTAGIVQGRKISVSDIVGPALVHSAVLAVITLVLFVPIMIGLGLAAGLKPNSLRDNAISVTSLAAGSVPEFFIGTVLIAVFFDQLNWFPPVSSIPAGVSVFAHPNALVLPIATLLIVSLSFGSRQLRSSVASILAQDYVTLARLNGYSQRTIIRHYILPNALAPTVQIVAQQLQYLVAGIVIVETVFNYPGIGNTLVRAVGAQDVQLVLVISMILATIYIAINLLADIVAILLDPVQRTSL